MQCVEWDTTPNHFWRRLDPTRCAGGCFWDQFGPVAHQVMRVWSRVASGEKWTETQKGGAKIPRERWTIDSGLYESFRAEGHPDFELSGDFDQHDLLDFLLFVRGEKNTPAEVRMDELERIAERKAAGLPVENEE